MANPVSWLQIEQGWNVFSADGTLIGTVAQVAGDKQDDILDGLAVKVGSSEQIGCVFREEIRAIHPGEVTLKMTALGAQILPPSHAPAPQPGRASLASHISNWMRRRR